MSNYYFPQEILIEIFANLPAKSLCRFMVVCKSWKDLITSSSFISKHLQHTLDNSANGRSLDKVTILLRGEKSKQCSLLEYGNDDNDDHDVKFDLSRIPFSDTNFSTNGSFRIVGSSNGLLCLATDVFFDIEQVLLWNPSIRKSFLVPQHTIEPTGPYVLVFGFGADLRDGDCKVVRIVFPKLSPVFGFAQAPPPEIEVYSSKRRTWKRVVQHGVRCRIMPFSKSQVLLNGCVHWLAYRWRENGLKNLLLAFDIGEEVFSEIMVPEELGRGNRVKLCYNLFEELLTVVKYIRGEEIMSCCIWVMKEYGVVESWTSTYSFDLVEGMERVVGVLGDGVVLVVKGRGELVSYDIKTSTIKEIGDAKTETLFYVDRHVESLLLLDE